MYAIRSYYEITENNTDKKEEPKEIKVAKNDYTRLYISS